MSWIKSIPSAWTGHMEFAEWLVNYLNPKTIVELGVDYGFSTFVFANALKQNNYNGIIYGIDLFEGDIHTGFRNNYDSVSQLRIEHGLEKHLEIIKGDFTQVCLHWDKPIQILHIDGLHTFDAVKNDYINWNDFVDDNGIILFHDVVSFYDVGNFFKSIEGGYKGYFEHSAGLGLYTKNKNLLDTIKDKFPSLILL